jgi:hypothetical protein
VNPADNVPLSCPEVRIAQAKIRRIRELADERGYDDRIQLWCQEADEQIDKVRAINRELRRLARNR